MVNGIDGVLMVNPGAVGGEFWYLSAEPHNDPRFNTPRLIGNYTDGFQVSVEPAFMTVENSIGYSSGSVRSNVNHSFIASTGFLYSSKDWTDVEMTGYFDCRSVENKNARIQIFARSAEIPGSRQWCPGSFYMGELAMDGQFRWVKSQYWLSAFQKDWISANEVGLGSDLTQRPSGWFGIKIVINNVDIGDGRLGVKLQLYVDRNNTNTWLLVGAADLVDSGGWGSDGIPCGGKEDQIITWGGPLATFRIEGDVGIVFNKLSVREVDVGGNFPIPEPTRQPDVASAGTFQRVIGLVTFRYRVGISVVPTCVGEIPGDPDPPPPVPPPGTITVDMSLAHRYDINSQSTSTVIIEEFPSST